ncbi:MAG: hypothetical protein ACT4QD_00975 [Acidobacteriota bacterium]
MTRRWVRPTTSTWVVASCAAGLSAATTAYLAVIYPSLPYALPVRYERGLPLIHQIKAPLTVFLPALIQAGLFVIFGALIFLLLWRGRPHDDSLESQDDASRMRLAAEGVALLAALWIGVQAVGAARLVLLWQRGFGGFGVVYNLVLLVSIVLSIAIVMRTMKVVGREPSAVVPIDPSRWLWKRLYFHPGDPALFAPARDGRGWTLNFGRPLAILLMVATLVVGIGGPFLLARLVLTGILR